MPLQAVPQTGRQSLSAAVFVGCFWGDHFSYLSLHKALHRGHVAMAVHIHSGVTHALTASHASPKRGVGQRQ
jgi:hypothetical protein